MRETVVPFQRTHRRRALKKKSSPPTLSTTACELVGKIAIIDRIHPDAMAALNVIADQFIPKARPQARTDLPTVPVVTLHRVQTIRRPNMIKMLEAKLAAYATYGPAEGYDNPEDIAVLRRSVECSIRAERTLIRVRRVLSIVNSALVGVEDTPRIVRREA